MSDLLRAYFFVLHRLGIGEGGSLHDFVRKASKAEEPAGGARLAQWLTSRVPSGSGMVVTAALWLIISRPALVDRGSGLPSASALSRRYVEVQKLLFQRNRAASPPAASHSATQGRQRRNGFTELTLP